MLPTVMLQEQDCREHFIRKFHGHRILLDSFIDFFAQTLTHAIARRLRNGWPQGQSWYPVCVLEFITQFRGMRAAEILSMSGYPLDGYALQRNLVEQALYIGAVVNGTSSFQALMGTKGVDSSKKWTEDDHQTIFKNRLAEEKRVMRIMSGDEAGLGAGEIEALAKWQRLFNLQVHGSRFTHYREAAKWLVEKGTPSVGPRIDDDASAMYMNRASEIGWLMLRAFPFLQLEDAPFDDDWQAKWHVLDDSFRKSVEGLSNLGKKIGSAFIAMIDAKFITSPKIRYVERL